MEPLGVWQYDGHGWVPVIGYCGWEVGARSGVWCWEMVSDGMHYRSFVDVLQFDTCVGLTLCKASGVLEL